MYKFDRTYRLVVGKSGGQGKEIKPPIHIEFEIEKTTKPDPNQHKIKIYNLKPETVEAISKPDGFCVLYAGYKEEEEDVLMAAGGVVDAYTYLDGENRITELIVADGWVELRDSAVSLGYGKGVNAHTIIKDIAGQMNLHLVMDKDVPNRTWEHGFSFMGAARKALDKVVAGTGLEWSVQNQTLQVIKKLNTTKRQAVVISPDSGLIGYPEKQREGAREKAPAPTKKGKQKEIVSAEQQRDGWKVTSLLLPFINPGDIVKVESREINDFYRVENVKHSGALDDGDWVSELELKEIK